MSPARMIRGCQVRLCGEKHFAKGYCNFHYGRFRKGKRGQDLLKPRYYDRRKGIVEEKCPKCGVEFTKHIDDTETKLCEKCAKKAYLIKFFTEKVDNYIRKTDESISSNYQIDEAGSIKKAEKFIQTVRCSRASFKFCQECEMRASCTVKSRFKWRWGGMDKYTREIKKRYTENFWEKQFKDKARIFMRYEYRNAPITHKLSEFRELMIALSVEIARRLKYPINRWSDPEEFYFGILYSVTIAIFCLGVGACRDSPKNFMRKAKFNMTVSAFEIQEKEKEDYMRYEVSSSFLTGYANSVIGEVDIGRIWKLNRYFYNELLKDGRKLSTERACQIVEIVLDKNVCKGKFKLLELAKRSPMVPEVAVTDMT